MATNKNAQLRYNALDKCFSNKYKKFFIKDLIEYCSKVLTEHYAEDTTVSRRQLINDMNFMKSEAGFDAPIESYKEGRKAYYHYSDTEFSILNSPLNPSEMATMNEALETLSRMNNIAGFDWVNSLQTKLQSGLNIQKNPHKVIDFEENEFLKGLEFLNPLYQYIVNRQSVEILYQSFNFESEFSLSISPYYLKQYNNRWFLFGWNHEVGKIQNLPLDRIHALEISKKKYVENTINFEEYFEDIIGVSNNLDEDPQIIKLELTENIIPYIISKPVHGSQKINGNILSIQVKLNYELASLILSFGENMKVLEPEKLVKNLKERVLKMRDFY